ncbi:MAG: hypothetical protein Q9221_004457 [Calogaya cf. arnoldii]
MYSRIARPRGGRRQPTQARPVGSNASPLSQSQSFPAPSWGANNSTTSAGAQQPSNGFSFGQAPGPFSQSQNLTGSNDNQMNSQNSSFPPFGGFNSNFGQQMSAPSSAGFNFAAPSTINNPFANMNQNFAAPATDNNSFANFNQSPTAPATDNNPFANFNRNSAAPATVNNPFANLNQSLNTQPTPNGLSGNFFNTPVQTLATPEEQAKEQEKLPAWERKPPSHWMTNLPPEDQQRDPQSFFVPHAPFKWGQPDPPAQEQPQQATTSADLGQQTPQTSTNLFGQNEPPKQDSNNMFAHLQQPSSPAFNPFAQQTGQQSQTSNANVQQNTSPFQPQSNQAPSNPFANLGGAAQGETPGNMFNNLATSPAKEGDSMSTTPDTSPQSNNDRERYGAFASVVTAPKPSLMNGSTPSGSGSNLFNFPSNPPNDRSSSSNTLGGFPNQSNVDAGSQDNENAPQDISLGSPTKKQSALSMKNRKIAQPTMGRPPKEDKTPAKNPFAGFSSTPSQPTASTPSFAVNGVSKPFQNQPNHSSETSTPSNTSAMNSKDAQKSPVSREAGLPPSPPDDFTEGQKRQFITGWRLKALDQGLQTYMEYSSYGDEEVEAISNFYQLRKQAILDANGGPVKDINSKRAAEFEKRQAGPQSKKVRRQPPTATSEQRGPASRTTSTTQGNVAKRKADEDLGQENGRTQPDSAKRSKPDDQVTYPSLPPSSSSQTAKMFGNLVGKKSDESLSNDDNPGTNGNLSNGVTGPDAASTPAVSSKSSLFFQAPDRNSGHASKQTSLFTSPAGSTSAPSQPKPANPDPSYQSLPTQSNSPFKGFFQSQSSQNNPTPPASINFSSNASNFFTNQPSNSSSLFGNVNGDIAQKSNAKRKANPSDESGDPGDEVNPEDSEEQRTKKQRTGETFNPTLSGEKENDNSFKPKSTTERIGFGESIFSRPGKVPTSTSNMFSHLGSSANKQDEDDADDDDDEANYEDDRPRRAKNGVKQTSESIFTNNASSVSRPNASGSSVFNPFAGSSFQTPKKPADDEKTSGRSLFDRIERDTNGQPMKAPKDLKDVDFGQRILKTPKTGASLDRTNQAPSSNIFGALSSAPSGETSDNAASTSATSTPAPASAFNLFGKPSNSNTAPMANVTGSKDVGGSPGGDNTWKTGTPLKFSQTSGAPSFNFTSPSPSKAPLSGLFGSPKASSTTETPGSFMFKPIDASSTKPAALTFGISAPPKDSLAPPSGTQSESTSRATSPGAGESGNEASDQVHEEESHPDLDTTEANRAEADEDPIFDVKAKAHKLTESKHFNAQTGKDEVTRKWTVQGAEQFRVLKNRVTNKTRMLMKLKVNGRVILNAGLEKSLSYVLASTKVVRVPVPTESKVESWTIQFGKEVDAKELARLLEENKAN